MALAAISAKIAKASRGEQRETSENQNGICHNQ